MSTEPRDVEEAAQPRQQFGALLLALVLLIALRPFLHGPLGRLGAALLLASLLTASVVAVRRHPAVRWVTGLAAVALALVAGSGVELHPSLASISLAGTLLFLAFATGCVLQLVLDAGPVGLDRLAGAVAVYLLIAIVCGLGYQLLELFEPGSFLSGGAALQPADREASLMYFSLVTLSTLGYGDIIPATHGARNLACLEAVLGQIYLAVLLARLVSLSVGGQALPPRATRKTSRA